MKIETASLEHGAAVRRVMYDDTRAEAADKPKAVTPWAWATALARYAFGYREEHKPREQEIETR